jgi:hypothetical protein
MDSSPGRSQAAWESGAVTRPKAKVPAIKRSTTAGGRRKGYGVSHSVPNEFSKFSQIRHVKRRARTVLLTSGERLGQQLGAPPLHIAGPLEPPASKQKVAAYIFR